MPHPKHRTVKIQRVAKLTFNVDRQAKKVTTSSLKVLSLTWPRTDLGYTDPGEEALHLIRWLYLA